MFGLKALKKIADSTVFQGFILGVIIFNAVLMGVQTISGLSPQVAAVLSTIDTVCLGIFIAEMLLKMLAYRLDYFRDGWNWFDMIIILVSVVSGLSFLSAFRALRVLRVFRSLKALKSMKLVSSVKHLQVIILAILKAIPSIIWTGILLVLVYYIFAVIGVSSFGEAFPEWFGSLGKAMYTLFQVMTLESWSMGISRPVMEVYPIAWVYFVPFVLISSFIVMNVVVGIVVNSISEVTTENIADKDDKDEADKTADSADESADLSSEIQALKEHIAKLETLIEKQKQ